VLDLVGYTTPYLIDITYEPLGVAVFAVGVAFVYIDQFEAVQLAAERDTPVIALDVDSYIRGHESCCADPVSRDRRVQRVLIWRRHSRKWPTALTAIIRF